MKPGTDFPFSAVFASHAELEGSTAFLLGRPFRTNPYVAEIRRRQTGGATPLRLWADAGAWRRGWERASAHRRDPRGRRIEPSTQSVDR